MKIRLARNLILSLVLACLFVGLQTLDATSKKSTAAKKPEITEATLVYVIDGDTIIVKLNGRKRHLRLIGIDTPESKPNDKAMRDSKRSKVDVNKITRLGRYSTDYVRTIITPGEKLRLEYDVEAHDKYDRILAYVFLPDGSMLNEKIVANGYASLMTIPPNVKYASRFQAAFDHARAQRLGLWQK